MPHYDELAYTDKRCYGVTEAAPVIAANQPDANRPGTVGHLMKALDRLEHPARVVAVFGQLAHHARTLRRTIERSNSEGNQARLFHAR